MSKYDFNKVALQLYWNHKSACVFFWKFESYLQNTFLEEHLLGTTSVFCFTGFSTVKKRVLVFCMIISFTRKIIFTWWIIFIVICRPAIVIKIRWWCHWRNKSWSYREAGKILPWCSWSRCAKWALVHGLWHHDKCLWHCCVKCAMFRCKLYKVSLNVLSWCSILSSSFSWNFCSSDVVTFCSFDSFLSIFLLCLFSRKSFIFSRDVDALERLWSEFDVSEIFWLSLAAIKVWSWKFNNVKCWCIIVYRSARSSSACCSVFSRVSLLSNSHSMDSVVGEPLHISLQIWKKVATILPPPLYFWSNTVSCKNAFWMWKNFIFCWR